MTFRENLKDILDCGKIKSFNDFLTFFFINEEQAPLYIELTGAKDGRAYYGTDGTIIEAPPLIVEDIACIIHRMNQWRRKAA